MLVHPTTQRQLANLYLNPVHAIGLIGACGAGKGYLAAEIVAKILKTPTEKLSTYAYMFTLDATVDGSIEKVRELQKFLHLRVPGADVIKRAVIIEHAEVLGREAQNALLKTLEEPPKDTIIICTVANRQELLPTVWSRLQWIIARPVSIEMATAELSKDYNTDEITRAYYMSEGNVALMLALLASDENHPIKQSVTTAKRILASSRYDRLKTVEELVKAKNYETVVDGLQRVLQSAVHISSKRATKKNSDELKRLYNQLTLVTETAFLLKKKVQPKLALTRLFYSL